MIRHRYEYCNSLRGIRRSEGDSGRKWRKYVREQCGGGDESGSDEYLNHVSSGVCLIDDVHRRTDILVQWCEYHRHEQWSRSLYDKSFVHLRYKRYRGVGRSEYTDMVGM